MKKILPLLMAAILLLSCKTDTEKITVASRTAICTGVAPMDCLIIKREGEDKWELFYDNIEGFDYYPGYEYVIRVKKEEIENPPADHSSIKYILVEEISKKEKVSEHIPF